MATTDQRKPRDPEALREERINQIVGIARKLMRTATTMAEASFWEALAIDMEKAVKGPFVEG